MSNAITLQTSLRTSAPRLAQPIGRFIAMLARRIAALSRPRHQSVAETAAELRVLANQYGSQPSFAADLRAAADRHEQMHGLN
jgi:hypothetical protein